MTTDSRTNILFITQSHWSEKELHRIGIEEFDVFTLGVPLCRFPEAGTHGDITVERLQLAKVLKFLATGRFAACMGYDTDMFLVHCAMRRNGMPALPLISITLEPGFPRHVQLARSLGLEDPEGAVAEFIARGHAFWFCATREFTGLFREAGIPGERLACLPYCTFTRSLFNPLGDDYLNGPPARTHDTARAVQDAVLAAGTFNRDYATFVRACRDIQHPAAIITHLPDLINTVGRKQVDILKEELASAPGITLYGAAPFQDYIDCLRRAAVVAVPLQHDHFTTGHLTISDAQHLGTPVVAADLATARDFIEHGRTGLLYEPGNPAALRRAVRDLLHDQALRRDIANNARRSEENLSQQARSELIQTLRAAAGGV